MAKKTLGKGIAPVVGGNFPGTHNKGIAHPGTTGTRVNPNVTPKRGKAKSQKLASGARTGILRLPSN